MNLVKWFRKNNTKVMAVVVIVLMVGFIGGSSLQYLLRGSGGAHKAIAYYGNKKKITPYQRSVARAELDVLQSLGAARIMPAQGLHGMLLSELLFSEQRGSPMVMGLVQRAIRGQQFRVSDKQINDLYRRRVPSDVYWILLDEETKAAGLRLSDDDVGQLLGTLAPQLFNGLDYAQLMRQLIRQHGLSERNIQEIFGRLLAVLQYAYAVCSTGPVTTDQIEHIVSRENETITAELVLFDTQFFSKALSEPSAQEIADQFERYKANFAGNVTQENPHGFGYKLDESIELEYLVIELEDVASIIQTPTDEDTERYYQNNRNEYTERVPEDPNDPNSLLTDRIKSYAEVADLILEQLTHQRVDTKAEQLLQEAKNLLDAKLDEAAAEQQERLSIEQRRALVGKYGEVAEQLTEKHGIPFHSGKTGLLTAADVQADEALGRLYLMAQQFNAVPLSQLVFAAEDLDLDFTGLQYARRPVMFQSIGPFRDQLAMMQPDFAGQIMALVRITRIEPAREPANVDVSFGTQTMTLDGEEQTDKVLSVREKVVDDLKRLAASDVTKAKTEEFVKAVAADGWDKAIDTFNDLYGKAAKEDPNDPNAFKIEFLPGLRRFTEADLAVFAAQQSGNPASRVILQEARVQRMFTEQLSELIPPGKTALESTPTIIEFKPNLSYYCIKDLSVGRLSEAEYQQMKVQRLLRQENSETMSLIAVHFDPENILKRMRFEPVREPSESENDESTAAEETS